jgi:predicted Zn-dependent peptidase
MRATLSRDYVEMVALCLPEDFAGGLRRLKWALFDPYFADEPFRFAQDRLAQEVMARQADAGSVAEDALVARLYPQWPGSWPLVGMGAAAWVNRTYAQSFQHDHYLSNLTLLSVCGPVEWSAVQQQTDAILGGLLPGGKPELLPPPVGAPPETEPWEGTVPGTPVCAVGVGARGPTLVAEDYPATSVLMALLGSGRGSRLYRRLREEQNASYTIEAGLTPSQVCPYVYMLASCTADQRAAVQAAMLAELADVRERLPSEEEVARARLVLWGQYQLQQQSAGDLAHYQGIFALLGGDEGLTDWQTLALRLSAVRPEQVQAMAQKYLAAPTVVTVRGVEGTPAAN